MICHSFLSNGINIEHLIIYILISLPLLWNWSFKTFLSNEEEVFVLLKVHAQKECVLMNFYRFEKYLRSICVTYLRELARSHPPHYRCQAEHHQESHSFTNHCLNQPQYQLQCHCLFQSRCPRQSQNRFHLRFLLRYQLLHSQRSPCRLFSSSLMMSYCS